MPLYLFKKQQRAPPVERVRELSSHGFSEPEIIDVLRREGYSPQEIDLALTQVLKEKLQTTSVEVKSKEAETTKIPTFEEVTKKLQLDQPSQAQQSQTQTEYSWEDYFNYIDYLIHSRVSELTKELEKINLKYQTLEKRIEEISQSMKETLTSKEESYSKILKKLEESSQKIDQLSQRINALEEIFKEILPALIESIRSLARLAQK